MLDTAVTYIEPVYNYSNVAGGYFNVYFGHDDKNPFKLSFAAFLEYRVREDVALYEYLQKRDDESNTVSHAIYDLYDIGFPVDVWVEEYIEYVKTRVDRRLFNALVQLFTTIKGFNSGSADSADL